MRIVSRAAVLVLVALMALVAPATAVQAGPVKPPPILDVVLAWDLPNWIDCPEGAGEIVGMTDGDQMDNKFRVDYTITACNSADAWDDLHGIAVGEGTEWWGIRMYATSGQHSFVWDTLGMMRVTVCVIVEMNSRGSCVEVYRTDGFTFHLGAPVPVDWAAVAGAETFDPGRRIPGTPVCPAC